MDIYCSEIKLKNGDKAFVRPISNSDKALIVDLFSKMTPGSIYLRFLRNMDELPENIINKLINVDYNKSFALVALAEGEAISVSRYGYDPDEKNTDLAVAVRDDFQQSGLGEVMMRKIVEIAKEKGIYHFTGIMAAQNIKIKGLLKKLGWKITYTPENGFYRVDIEV